MCDKLQKICTKKCIFLGNGKLRLFLPFLSGYLNAGRFFPHFKVKAYNLKRYSISFNEIQKLINIEPNRKCGEVEPDVKKLYCGESNIAVNFNNQTTISSLNAISKSRILDTFAENMLQHQKYMKKLFRTPKQTVNNFFDQLAHRFRYDELRLFSKMKTIYIEGNTFWLCETNIKWPEEKIISSVKSNKKDAARECSLAVLNFLCHKNVISSAGKPLLCNNSNNPLIISSSEKRMYSTRSAKRNQKEKLAVPQITEDAVKENSVLDEAEDLKITQLFPTPKCTLSNIYQQVSKEKDFKENILSSTFKKNNNIWVCTYKIKWPEEEVFTAMGSTKQKSSYKCARKILAYLLNNNKISEKAVPTIYNKEELKKFARDNIPALIFNENHMEKLTKIVDLHTKHIFPILVDTTEQNNVIEEVEEEFVDTVRNHEQKFLGYNKYKCKEEKHLPVSDYKQEIIEMIRANRVVVVKGEPGCGKSTRIPQYILEGWAQDAEKTGRPCRIVVTEPRRIAAVSLAERVSSERNESVGDIVGYQVRFKSNFQYQSGRILYCTNGILLQQFKSDPNLSMYTHVVIDEAHERDINTDLLLTMLRKILVENPLLKVVIMSATIDTELFQSYFDGSALIHIPGFTYPVKSHFIDKCSLHLDKTIQMCNESASPSVIHADVVRVLLHVHRKKPEGAILCFLPGWEDIRQIRDLIPPSSDLNVLCLHSRLQDQEQWKIFSRSPPGVRKIILSTNIAETSVTIDDVVYVVDTGIHKETTLDAEKGVMCIDNHWISRSSVDQRKGRAGRVRAGESFHLYPEAKMMSFAQFSSPEVLRVSLTKVVLDSKAYCQDMNALKFFSELPSPPSQENVKLAVDELTELELIDDKEKLTPLGEVVVHFQLEPKLSKTLVNSIVYQCVTPIVDIVTLFSQGTEIFASGLDMKGHMRRVKSNFSNSSDHMAVMRILEIWDDFIESGDRYKSDKFCNDLNIVPARMNVLRALKKIHFNYLKNGLKLRVLPISDDFSDEDEIVKAVLLSGVGTFLSHKKMDIAKGRLAKGNALITRLNHKANITPDSVNFNKTSSNSNFLLYINETRSNLRRTTLIRETSLISALTILLFSNRKLLMHNLKEDEFSPSLQSEDQVILTLAGTKVKFILDRQHALALMQCKLSITSCYDHFVFHLCKGGEHNPILNQLWSQILFILCDLLEEFKNH